MPGEGNVVADAFSRIAAIDVPSQIDYDKMASMQASDEDLKCLLQTGAGLVLKQVTLPVSKSPLCCDVS